ncbi:MAG TPA: AraC family transcriptional regulator [Sphingobium sp.]|uniref:AraC family transcriptional regulator n=1 Tax=Sphingobium sp. TaxID=1912891 RepID=UPI002ED63E36
MSADQPRSTQPGSVSELLSLLDLTGRNWSYVELGTTSGYSAPPSDAIYVHVVLHGAARLTGVTGGTLILEAGQAAIVLSGEAHALRTVPESSVTPLDFLRDNRTVDVPPTVALGATGAVTVRILSARLGIAWPDGLHRGALPAIIPITLEGDGSPAMILRPEAFRLAGFGAGSTALLTRLASLMLISTLRGTPHYLAMLQAPRTDSIDQALCLISANPSAPWTVEGLARAVGMGRSNFAAHFTAKVGRAPMEVITDKRMEQALHLLRQSSHKIAEIAEITGYGSEAAFSRRFTRHFGSPPSHMREQPKPMDTSGADKAGWQQLLPRGRLGDSALPLRQGFPEDGQESYVLGHRGVEHH